MKDLIETIAKALVDYPEQVRVKQIEGESILILELRVAQGDIGKIIGKQGRTVQAIRTILAGASGKLGKRATLEIIDH